MSYVRPEDVTAPKARWTLIKVLRSGESGEAAYAIGPWDNEARIACRWNGTKKSPLGNPTSFGNPTWMVLEPSAGAALLRQSGLIDDWLVELVAERFETRLAQEKSGG